MSSVRQERANSEIIDALSYIIREKVNDPRIKGEIITLTYVKTSPDFRYCKVGVSVLGNRSSFVVSVLKKCEGFIKRELINMIKLPYAPKLDFTVDLGEQNSERINEILKNLDSPAEETSSEDEDI